MLKKKKQNKNQLTEYEPINMNLKIIFFLKAHTLNIPLKHTFTIYILFHQIKHFKYCNLIFIYNKIKIKNFHISINIVVNKND